MLRSLVSFLIGSDNDSDEIIPEVGMVNEEDIPLQESEPEVPDAAKLEKLGELIKAHGGKVLSINDNYFRIEVEQNTKLAVILRSIYGGYSNNWGSELYAKIPLNILAENLEAFIWELNEALFETTSSLYLVPQREDFVLRTCPAPAILYDKDRPLYLVIHKNGENELHQIPQHSPLRELSNIIHDSSRREIILPMNGPIMQDILKYGHTVVNEILKPRICIPRGPIEQIIQAGFDLIEPAFGTNLVLAVGNSRAGKSTLINYLRGHRFKRDRHNTEHIAVLDGPMGSIADSLPGPESVTFYPEVLKSSQGGFSYCDCAGFNENRGRDAIICTSINTRFAIEFASSVQAVIVVVNLADLAAGAVGLRTLCTSLSSFFKNLREIQDSVLFAITRAEPSDTRERVVKTIEKVCESLSSAIERDNESLRTSKDERERLDLAKRIAQQWDQLNILNLMKSTPNLIVADIFDNGDTRRQIIKFIKKGARPISKDQFGLSVDGDIRHQIDSMVLRNANKGYNLLAEKKRLEDNIRSLQDDWESTKASKDNWDKFRVTTKVERKDIIAALISNNDQAKLQKQAEFERLKSEKKAKKERLAELDRDDEVSAFSMPVTSTISRPFFDWLGHTSCKIRYANPEAPLKSYVVQTLDNAVLQVEHVQRERIEPPLEPSTRKEWLLPQKEYEADLAPYFFSTGKVIIDFRIEKRHTENNRLEIPQLRQDIKFLEETAIPRAEDELKSLEREAKALRKREKEQIILDEERRHAAAQSEREQTKLDGLAEKQSVATRRLGKVCSDIVEILPELEMVKAISSAIQFRDDIVNNFLVQYREWQQKVQLITFNFRARSKVFDDKVTSVYIAGDFNGWLGTRTERTVENQKKLYQLHELRQGEWQVQVELLPRNVPYHYQFVVYTDANPERPLLQAEQEVLVNEVYVRANVTRIPRKPTDLTPLQIAISQGDDERAIGRLLDENSDDINAQGGEYGETALHVAVRCGRVNILRLLISKKADVNRPDNKKRTPLHIAVTHQENADVMVQELLRAGAQSYRVDSERNTPIHKAAANKNFVVMRRLLESAIPLTCLSRNDDGDSPFHLAAKKGDGEDVDANGETLIELLKFWERDTRTRSLEKTEYLYSTTKDKNEDTFFHVVVRAQRLEVLKRLVVLRCLPVDHYNGEESTSLHLAVTSGWAEGVSVLLDAGADTELKNRQNLDVFDLLSGRSENDEISKRLFNFKRMRTEDKVKRILEGSRPRNLFTLMDWVRFSRTGEEPLLEQQVLTILGAFLQTKTGRWFLGKYSLSELLEASVLIGKILRKAILNTNEGDIPPASITRELEKFVVTYEACELSIKHDTNPVLVSRAKMPLKHQRFYDILVNFLSRHYYVFSALYNQEVQRNPTRRDKWIKALEEVGTRAPIIGALTAAGIVDLGVLSTVTNVLRFLGAPITTTVVITGATFGYGVECITGAVGNFLRSREDGRLKERYLNFIEALGSAEDGMIDNEKVTQIANRITRRFQYQITQLDGLSHVATFADCVVNRIVCHILDGKDRYVSHGSNWMLRMMWQVIQPSPEVELDIVERCILAIKAQTEIGRDSKVQTAKGDWWITGHIIDKSAARVSRGNRNVFYSDSTKEPLRYGYYLAEISEMKDILRERLKEQKIDRPTPETHWLLIGDSDHSDDNQAGPAAPRPAQQRDREQEDRPSRVASVGKRAITEEDHTGYTAHAGKNRRSSRLQGIVAPERMQAATDPMDVDDKRAGAPAPVVFDFGRRSPAAQKRDSGRPISIVADAGKGAHRARSEEEDFDAAANPTKKRRGRQ